MKARSVIGGRSAFTSVSFNPKFFISDLELAVIEGMKEKELG